MTKDSQKMSSFAAVAFVMLAGIWAWWWVVKAPPPPQSTPEPQDIIPPSLVAPERVNAPGAGQVSTYAAPGGSDLEDMRMLARCAASYLNQLGYMIPWPLKDNEEWGMALRGELKGTMRWLAPGPPIFSKEGKIIDRHGTPVQCLNVGARSWEFRSAGPDKTLFTGDDAVSAFRQESR